jgi:hypothetical protein
MDIVIEFGTSEGPRVESDRVQDALFIEQRQDCAEGIVRSISFHDQGSVGNPMRQNWSRSESLLEEIEGLLAFFSKYPRGAFAGKPG